MKVTLQLELRPVTRTGVIQERVLKHVVRETRTDYQTHAYINFFFPDGTSESWMEELIRDKKIEEKNA